MSRPAFLGLMAVGGALMWLHVAHALVGHLTFVRVGPPAAAVRALGCAWALLPGDWNDAALRWSRTFLAGLLTVLLVVPEWIEGELSGGHGLRATVLRDHGEVVLAVLGVALLALMAWEARRTLRLLEPWAASDSNQSANTVKPTMTPSIQYCERLALRPSP